MPSSPPTARFPCLPRPSPHFLRERWCGCTSRTECGPSSRRAEGASMAERGAYGHGGGGAPDGDGEMEAPPLDLVGVTVRYGDTVAVVEATLQAYAGEFIAITGHSGAGKSSLL